MHKKAIDVFARRGYCCNKSGEEIQPFLDYCTENGIPLIVISKVSIIALEVGSDTKTPEDARLGTERTRAFTDELEEIMSVMLTPGGDPPEYMRLEGHSLIAYRGDANRTGGHRVADRWAMIKIIGQLTRKHWPKELERLTEACNEGLLYAKGERNSRDVK